MVSLGVARGQESIFCPFSSLFQVFITVNLLVWIFARLSICSATERLWSESCSQLEASANTLANRDEIWYGEVLIILPHHVDTQEIFLPAGNEIRGRKYPLEGRQGLLGFLFLPSGKWVAFRSNHVSKRPWCFFSILEQT